MMDQRDLLRSLDEAAEQMEKHAKDVLDLHLATRQLILDREELQRPMIDVTRRVLIVKRLRNHIVESRQHFDRHNEIGQDVASLLRRIDALAPKLDKERQERIESMKRLERDRQVQANFKVAGDKLKNMTIAWNRTELYREGNDMQAKLSRDLQEMARVLRTPADLLAALKEAATRVEEAIKKQAEVTEETKKVQPKEEDAQGRGQGAAQGHHSVPGPGGPDPEGQDDPGRPQGPARQGHKGRAGRREGRRAGQETGPGRVRHA
jgi:hypothetical protein